MSSNIQNNSDDFHLQPKEDTPIREEKGIPMWIGYILLFVVVATILTCFFNWKNTPVNELVYKHAVKEVENDLSIFSGASFEFEDFDEKYVNEKDKETYNVEVMVHVSNANGVQKNYIYDVQIKVKNNICKTVYCMRRLDSK